MKQLRKPFNLIQKISVAALGIACLVGAGFYLQPLPVNAACSAPATAYGTATATLVVPSGGTYAIWTRMMAPDTTNNAYMLEIDGTTCVTVGGASMTPNSWLWVSYQNGNTSSKITQNLTAGSHTIKMIGTKPSVKIDRILAVTDAACTTPTGTGDNCTATVDSTPPNVSLTKPADGSTVNGSVSIQVTATDDVGISKVEFYVNSQLKATSTNAPYSYAWDSTGIPNGTYNITVKAYDAAGNVDSDSRTVTVVNGDTQAPSAPTNLKATVNTAGKVVLSWNASTDNTGVTGYIITRGGNTVGTATATTYTDTTVAAGTTYSYQVAAYDAANNRSVTSASASVATPQVADTQAPSAPSQLNATAASDTQINLSWSASTDNVGVASYDVYRSTGNNQAAKLASTTNLSFGDTGLVASTSYSYYVVARDGAGNSSPHSATVTATTNAVPTNGGGNNTGGNGNHGNNHGGSQGQIPGDIRGKITGRNGRALSGAHVVVVVNGHRYQTTSNRNGIYRIYNIPVGDYTMKITAHDYQSRSVAISITNDNLTIRNIQLTRR